jgi:predicted  nucleic acid-binding Zn-ribbon protein
LVLGSCIIVIQDIRLRSILDNDFRGRALNIDQQRLENKVATFGRECEEIAHRSEALEGELSELRKVIEELEAGLPGLAFLLITAMDQKGWPH